MQNSQPPPAITVETIDEAASAIRAAKQILLTERVKDFSSEAVVDLARLLIEREDRTSDGKRGAA